MFAFPSCVVGRHVGFQVLGMTALCTHGKHKRLIRVGYSKGKILASGLDE